MSSYLGNIPSNNFVSLKRQVISGNGGASYTLDYSVASVNDVAIFVNNVRQDPASYSISGTALTLGGTISSSDSCYIIFLGQGLQTVTPANNTITNAMLSETITVANGGTGLTSGFKNGITEVDQWRLTASITSNINPISANLERNDSTGFGYIGTGMSVSSGTWTFPSTGIWLVRVNSIVEAATDDNVLINTLVTTDNSTYSSVAITADSGDDSNTGAGSSTSEFFFNCTDTSTHKVRFKAQSINSGSYISGTTTYNNTSFSFIRLGDST
tara:strand:- start:107 stop:919 length:813 start_codon:yes stop_codon:yes gene_type:complete